MDADRLVKQAESKAAGQICCLHSTDHSTLKANILEFLSYRNDHKGLEPHLTWLCTQQKQRLYLLKGELQYADV